jgi:hypothetical protein
MVVAALFTGDVLQVAVDSFVRLSKSGYRHAHDFTIDGRRDTSVKLLRLAIKPLLAVMSTLSDTERNEIKIVLRRYVAYIYHSGSMVTLTASYSHFRIAQLQIDLRNKRLPYKTRRNKANELLRESKELYRQAEVSTALIY